MADFAAAIADVGAGRDLSADTMAELVGHLLRGEIEPTSPQADQVRQLLIALAEKGETADELVGAARAMRTHMTPIRHSDDVLLDTCGTGGSRSGTFNISTAAAIVVSAAGVPVAKHGNRKATSRSGSADVLAELGVGIESERETVEQSLDRLNLCFCFAPKLHPAMRHVAEIRKTISQPTMFNLIGPLCNPAGATHQLLGTGREEMQQRIADALSRLGTIRSVVVRGEDGQDEVSLDGTTTAIEVHGEEPPIVHHWTAADFHLHPAGQDAMQVDSPADSARVIREILHGAVGPCRDIVLANAAVAFWLVRRVDDLESGTRLAAETIDSGHAEQHLKRFIRFQPAHHVP